MWNAEQHATKCNQADAAGFVQKPLEFFGVGPGAQPMLQAVSSLVAVDHSTLCHGYWPRDVRYKGRIYDTAVLLEQWRDGEAWYINRGFTATLCYEATPGATPICPVGSIVVWSNFSGATTVRMEGKVTAIAPSGLLDVAPSAASMLAAGVQAGLLHYDDGSVSWWPTAHVSASEVLMSTFTITGTFKSRQCGHFCIDQVTGCRLPNLMCTACSNITVQDDFRARVLLANTPPSAKASRTRIDRLPTVPAIISVARAATKRCRTAEWGLMLARCALARSQKQVRSMRERMEASIISGDLRTFAADVRFCVDNGKFEGREPLLSFIKDVVHDLRLQSDEGKHSRGMRWHESTKRLLAVLKKFGGPRSHQPPNRSPSPALRPRCCSLRCAAAAPPLRRFMQFP